MKAIVPKKIPKNEVFYFMNGKRMAKPYEVIATSPFDTLEKVLEHIEYCKHPFEEERINLPISMDGTISIEIAEYLAERGHNVEYFLHDKIICASCFITQALNEKGDIFYHMPNKKAKRK